MRKLDDPVWRYLDARDLVSLQCCCDAGMLANAPSRGQPVLEGLTDQIVAERETPGRRVVDE